MRAHPAFSQQRGAALLVILAIIGLGAAFLLVGALNKSNRQIERDKTSAAALAQAKEALLGYAATYRDTHPDMGGNRDKVFGYLPCPDTNNDGLAEPSCGTKDVTVAGRLPWKTLGLPALRDSAGECLWYVVSGRAKDNPATDVLNWDSVGLIEVRDAAGQVLAAPGTHNTPWAMIVAPGAVTGAQDRTPAGTSECGGNSTAAAYLEGLTLSPAAGGVSTLVLATSDSTNSGTNNDRGLSIASREIFDRIRRRSDFASDIGTLLSDLKTTLDAATPPRASAFSAAATTGCPVTDGPADQKKDYFRCHWNSHLKFAESAGIKVNGETCDAVLIFAGERAAGQSRLTAADQSNPANYLEAPNLSLFPGSGDYLGATGFDPAAASRDIVRCIKTPSAPPTQVTFASNFGDFQPSGAGVSTDSAAQTATVGTAAGASGGCFWYLNPVPLSGKTLRAYYRFQFLSGDPSGGPDLGNGFTFSLLRGDIGAPATCGTKANMGALPASDLLGFISLLVENDVRRDVPDNDPAGNHSAILYGGNTAHSAISGGNGYTTSACDGSAQGCLFSPTNKYEESPSPLSHNQRIEIHPGYSDATCTTTSTGGAYAKIKTWVDCASCNDTASDFSATPAASRCLALPAEMDSVYFGFTGGFSNPQGVIIWNLDLRTQ